MGRKAESIAHIVGGDAEALICAAWLHDIGYAPVAIQTGLHQLDGARYLRDVEQVEIQICRLVAHHSCAIVEARNRRLAGDLLADFPPIKGLTADSLTFCDMTTSPDGYTIDIEARFQEIFARYGEGDIVGRSVKEAREQIRHSVRAVASLIEG